ncbi:MAG: PQQ-binding-like beta-propeller repeat protein, partial [bacterium]
GAIRGRPSFDGRDLWVGTDAGTLWMISAEGKVLGSHDLGSPVRSSPAIAGPHGTAVITRDGILTLLSGGERIWSRQLAGQGTYAPPVYVPGSGIAAGDGSGAVSMLDLKGALYWRTSLGSAVHSLRRQGDLLWAGTEDGAVVVLQPATGRVLERHADGGAVHGGPVLLERPRDLAVWGARDGLVRAFSIRLTEGPWEAPQ